MIDEREVWQLLEFYMDLVEKQDEVIHRLGKVISRQAEALRLIENDRGFSDPKLEKDMAAAEEVTQQYYGSVGMELEG